jgi:hypothetical protein
MPHFVHTVFGEHTTWKDCELQPQALAGGIASHVLISTIVNLINQAISISRGSFSVCTKHIWRHTAQLFDVHAHHSRISSLFLVGLKCGAEPAQPHPSLFALEPYEM